MNWYNLSWLRNPRLTSAEGELVDEKTPSLLKGKTVMMSGV
jgi:hypothetical protein